MESKQIELLNRKNSFENWLKERKDLHAGGSESHLEFLKDKGFLVFEEDSADKVRLEASIFLTRKKDFELSDTRFFYNCVYLLLSYAEYLEELEKKVKEDVPAPREKSSAERRKELLILAYYLARREKKGLKDLHYDCQQSAFDDISEKLKFTPETIREMTYEYKAYFDNGGYVKWHQKDFSGIGKEVSDYCDNMNHCELSALVKEILKSYGWADEDNILGYTEAEKVPDYSTFNLYNVFEKCKEYK